MNPPKLKQIKNKPLVYAPNEYVDTVLIALHEEMAEAAADFEEAKKQFFVSTATDLSKKFWLGRFGLYTSDKWKPAVFAALRRGGTLTEARLNEFIAVYTGLTVGVDFEIIVAAADYTVCVRFLSEVPSTISMGRLKTLLRALIPAHLLLKVEKLTG